MAERTGIEWCDHTWSPWVGCTQVRPACDYCYAKDWAARFRYVEWNGPPRRTSEHYWQQPIRWEARAAECGLSQSVFPSLCDPFDNQVPTKWHDDFWRRIHQTPRLLWLLLTKRPQNIERMLPDHRTGVPDWGDGWPNVWIGTTAEDAAHYRQRWAHVAAIPARVRFLSYEPALGDIGNLDLGRVGAPNWIIAGGESGRHARPCHPDWVRSVRDQCAAAGVPFFFKQWGEWLPTNSLDVYCHGPNRNEREFPQSPGLAWLRDGRICLEDFSVEEHARRIRNGLAHSTRAVEIDDAALREFHDYVERRSQNNPGYQWMYRVGKKRAGALLDGREWRQFPYA